MPRQFEPRFDGLPDAQKKLWALLAPAPHLGFVLYGGTAVALHLGHRRSLDFVFFRYQQTSDSALLVASLEDLLATKLKAILDRAEAKDYRDIAAMLGAGVNLERGLAAFSKMFDRDPGLPLRAMGYFKDGDLSSLSPADQRLLRSARDRVDQIPDIELTPGSLA